MGIKDLKKGDTLVFRNGGTNVVKSVEKDPTGIYLNVCLEEFNNNLDLHLNTKSNGRYGTSGIESPFDIVEIIREKETPDG